MHTAHIYKSSNIPINHHQMGQTLVDEYLSTDLFRTSHDAA